MSDAELIRRLHDSADYLDSNLGFDIRAPSIAKDLRDAAAQLAGPAPIPSGDPAQDGYYNQQKCSQCGVLAIDFAVVCAFCQAAGPAREPQTQDLERDIAAALNRVCAENASNTPDFILAQFLIGCLAAWNAGVQQRETWYGRDVRPTGGNGIAPSPSPTPEPQP